MFLLNVIDQWHQKFLVLQMVKENQYEYQNDDVVQQEYYLMMKLDETKDKISFVLIKTTQELSLLYS
jgi:hypothetical protein